MKQSMPPVLIGTASCLDQAVCYFVNRLFKKGILNGFQIGALAT